EALALAHLGRWPEAHACFATLRRQPMPSGIMHAARDSLLDANGNRRVVQGIIRTSGNLIFLKIDDLGTDGRLDRRAQWPSDGSIAHAHIDFSFAGPTAIYVDA